MSEVLILIDVQTGFQDSSWGRPHPENVFENLKKLLLEFRQKKKPVIHVQHLSTEEHSLFRPERATSNFVPEFVPLENEKVFKKNVHSGFIGTDLEEYLKDQKFSDLILAGFTVDHCVSTTTRMAQDLGFNVTLVSDATAGFDRNHPKLGKIPAQVIHSASIASLSGEFARIIETSELVKSGELL